MRFTDIDINFDVRYEGHQNCPKLLSMNILRVFSDHHLWHQNWCQYLWTSLCQFNFFVNLLHSLGVWFFDIWHLFDNLTCTPHPCTLLPHMPIPLYPISLYPIAPCGPHPLHPLPMCPYVLYPIPLYPIAPYATIAHTPVPHVCYCPMCPIAHLADTQCTHCPLCPIAQITLIMYAGIPMTLSPQMCTGSEIGNFWLLKIASWHPGKDPLHFKFSNSHNSSNI